MVERIYVDCGVRRVEVGGGIGVGMINLLCFCFRVE